MQDNTAFNQLLMHLDYFLVVLLSRLTAYWL